MKEPDSNLEAVLHERAERLRARSEDSDTLEGDPHVVFQVNDLLCAVPVTEVETVMEVPDLREVAGMPKAYLGIFGLRGRFYEAFCLESLVAGEEGSGERGHVLMLRMGREQVAVRVGEVEGIRELDPAAWTPLTGTDWPDWLTASTSEPCYLVSTSALWEVLTRLS